MKSKHRNYNLIRLFMITVLIICSMVQVSFAEKMNSEVSDDFIVYSSVKNVKEANKIKKQVNNDFINASELYDKYIKKYKNHTNTLKAYLKKYQESYNKGRQPSLDRAAVLNKKIKKNTKKRNTARSQADEKLADYYQGLINKYNNELDEIYKTMDEDYEIFMAVKSDVTEQLKKVNSTHTSIKKKYSTVEELKIKVNKNVGLLQKKHQNKTLYKKRIVNNSNELNEKMPKLVLKLKSQLEYFNEYARNAQNANS